MKRELASMTWPEVREWAKARREEIWSEFNNGHINNYIHDELEDWVTQECLEYIKAYGMGLIRNGAQETTSGAHPAPDSITPPFRFGKPGTLPAIGETISKSK